MIGKATVENIPELLADICVGFEEMAPFGDLDLDKCKVFLKDSIENHIILAARSNETKFIIGHMCLRAETHWYTNDYALFEHYIYIKPKFRKTRTAFRLYNAAKSIAQSVQLPFFYGTFRKPESGFDRVDRFLKRQGGVQVGANYFWKGE